MNTQLIVLIVLSLTASVPLLRAIETQNTLKTLIETLFLSHKDGFTGQKLIFELLQKLIDPFQTSESRAIKTFGPLVTSIISSDAIESFLSAILVLPKQCLAPEKGYVHDELGDFITTQDSPYCDSNCGRNLLCCAPSRPEEAGVTYIYANGIDPPHFVTEGDEDFREDVQGSKKPLIFYLNGSLENYTVDFWINDTRDGLLKSGYNVVLVDWSYSKFAPIQHIADSRIVGALVGHLIKWLDYVDHSTCLGASTAAHACGEVGKWLKQRGFILPKCIALDATSGLYEKCSKEVIIDRSDCGVVIGVHTSRFTSYPGLLVGKVGATYKIGHCDFYVNDANLQPNCFNASILNYINNLVTGKIGKFDYDLELLAFCSHQRAELLFRSQVNKFCDFHGWRVHKCQSEQGCQVLAPSMIPADDPAPYLMRFPPFDGCTSDMRADYQISTTGKDPFC